MTRKLNTKAEQNFCGADGSVLNFFLLHVRCLLLIVRGEWYLRRKNKYSFPIKLDFMHYLGQNSMSFDLTVIESMVNFNLH